MPRQPPFSEDALRAAVSASTCWAEALRLLRYQNKGANFRTLQTWAARWGIATDHFDSNAARARAGRARATPLSEVMVENSTYARGKLKERLLASGLKRPQCELCGQDEVWRGERMSLVLDYINGISNDHRLENLRIVCPNCAATLDTHCGHNLPRERICATCGERFAPRHIRHRYCSRTCSGVARGDALRGYPHPECRKVERPEYEQLLADVRTLSMRAVGHKYGVSDNAVRKWLRAYERERSTPEGEEAA